MEQAIKNSRYIAATPEEVYSAFINPAALEVWQAPGDMKAKVHYFELKVGGGYQMSLYYPDNETTMKGKTTDKEDKYTARFVELIPNKKIVEAILFDTANPGFAGEMLMEVGFEAVDADTRVTILFKNIPPAIRPEDNEAGTISSLEKLARYVETNKRTQDNNVA